ncbi:hypothetical protein CNR22_19185 [Sphingobacteriaceae bacterium]|nr:hypothetical protein CNR22_19185 [Sphingobacteriaceae bacterium]
MAVLSLQLDAQKDAATPISQEEWKEMSDGVDYTETYKEQEQNKKNEQVKTSDFKTDFRFGAFNYIFYIVVFVVIGLLIYWIFRNLGSNKEVKPLTVTIDSMTHIEEHIHEVNLEALLNEAVLAKNYRIALRLNFLIVIKLLSQRDKINWAKEKTNWEYHSELKETVLADQFKEIIKSFEIFWYGEHLLTELDYHNTEPAYKALQNQLKTR